MDIDPQFRQQLARYERVIAISQHLNSTLDHATLLDKIIAAASELTDSESASILLIDPATGELRFESATSTPDDDLEDIIVPLEGSIAGWVVTHGEARVIQDVRNEPTFFKNVDDSIGFQTRNILAVPLKTTHKVIGVLEAVNKRDGERFNDQDVKFLTTLSVHAAIAIENARLFQQSDFMAEMVHELRTPLAALRTSLSLLRREAIASDRRDEIMGIMTSETERLIRMTTEFLDLARLESGRIRLEYSDMRIDELVSECLDLIAPQAAERGIRLMIDLQPTPLQADRAKIKQVLLNLLTNAVKYNRPSGDIIARCHPTQRAGAPSVEMSISDTGMGVSKEHQRQMFQKFFRVSGNADIQGTGLGLAIAKRIVEAHHGTIWVESELGAGSTFYVALPIEP